jgi:hypothetical protein
MLKLFAKKEKKAEFPIDERTRKVREGVAVRDAFAKVVAITLAGTTASFGLSLLVLMAVLGVANKPAPTLVQLSDGESIHVGAIDGNDRSEASIRNFTLDTLTAIFTWSGVYPSSEPGEFERDPGIDMYDGKGNRLGRVTVAAATATLAMELNFRDEFLKRLATLVPESVFTGRVDLAFVPLEIGKPVALGAGRWKVPVLSDLVFTRDGKATGKTIPYNADVYVRSVPPINAELVDKLVDPRAKSLATRLGKSRRAGLEIYSIAPYKAKELKDGKADLEPERTDNPR